VATRAQVLIPVFVAAVIIGVAGIMTMPTDKMLQSVEFPKGTIKVDDIVLFIDIAVNVDVEYAISIGYHLV